jgi:hypothetical protein
LRGEDDNEDEDEKQQQAMAHSSIHKLSVSSRPEAISLMILHCCWKTVRITLQAAGIL